MNKRGFGSIEIVLVIVVLAAAGFVGLQVYRTRQAQNTADAHLVSKAQTKKLPSVKSASDVDKVNKSIDQLNFDATLQEGNQLNNDVQLQ